ncbi:MAG: SurA N-terminal domain-containing protein [Pseudomonadales bacterium]
MLQKLRDQTQSLGFKVLVAILVFVLAVFGFGAFNLFVGGEPEVASVNGEGITESALSLETERERRRIAAQLGEQFDPALIDPIRLQNNVLERMIAREVLGQAADDLGVAVSRSQVDAVLVSNPAFQIADGFSPDLYRQAVQSLGYTAQAFVDETARLMALEQMQNALTNSAFITERELNLHATLLAQRRDVAYLPFPVERYRAKVEVSDDDVALRYQENEAEYVSPERVDVAYVTLSLEELMNDAAISADEDELQAAYAAERAEAPDEELRNSRHILLEVGAERSAEAAREALEGVRERLQAGESFADLAREFSEDPGSASTGGELGLAGRGVFDPAFESALFELEKPGDVSAPVETEFGMHLIELVEVRRTEFPPFEAARADLERQVRERKASELFEQRLRELDNLAFEQPESLDGIAEAMGLTVATASGVTRAAGSGPFGNDDLRGRLFDSEVLVNRFNSPAVTVAEGQAVVARVTERHPPEPIPLAEVADDIRADIELERAQVMLAEAQADALARLEAGESTAAVATAHDASWQTFEGIRRNDAQVPRAVVQVAFGLRRPEAGGKSLGVATLPAGGQAVVAVTRVEDADVAAIPASELEGMRGFLAGRAADHDFGSVFQTYQDEARIRRAE